jgi:hypothetical protein
MGTEAPVDDSTMYDTRTTTDVSETMHPVKHKAVATRSATAGVRRLDKSRTSPRQVCLVMVMADGVLLTCSLIFEGSREGEGGDRRTAGKPGQRGSGLGAKATIGSCRRSRLR